MYMDQEINLFALISHLSRDADIDQVVAQALSIAVGVVLFTLGEKRKCRGCDPMCASLS